MCGVLNKREFLIKFNGFNKILARITPFCHSGFTEIILFCAIVDYITTQEQTVVYLFLCSIKIFKVF